jgi:hypothetical protein
MQLLCADRDRLWAHYDDALRQYAQAVDCMARFGGFDSAEHAEDARQAVDNARIEILRHCRDCGCDPDWVKVFEPAPQG